MRATYVYQRITFENDVKEQKKSGKHVEIFECKCFAAD